MVRVSAIHGPLAVWALLLVSLWTPRAVAQTAPLEIVQSDDGTLYVTQAATAWTLVPDTIEDDALAGLSPAGELDGVIPTPLLGGPTPPRAVLASDGSLFVVQGSSSWTLVPDAISASDLAALTVTGELDGTLSRSAAAQAPTGAAVPAPAHAPAPPPLVIPTARMCYQFVAKRDLGTSGVGNPLPVVVTVYINNVPPRTQNLNDSQPAAPASGGGGDFNLLNVPGNWASILDGTTLYEAPPSQLFVEMRNSSHFYLRVYSGIGIHLAAAEIELGGPDGLFGPSDPRQPVVFPTSFPPLDAYTFKSISYSHENHSLMLTSISTGCSLPVSSPTPPDYTSVVGEPSGFDWSMVEAFTPPSAWQPVGVIEKGQTASFSLGSEIALSVETDMSGTSSAAGNYEMWLDVPGPDGTYVTAGTPGCQARNPQTVPLAASGECIRAQTWVIYPDIRFSMLQAAGQGSGSYR